MTSRTLRWTLVASGLVVVTGAWGCGDGGKELPRQAVAGTVTLDWTPLKSGVIRFQSTSSSFEYKAETRIADGKYFIPRDKGLVPGIYRVAILVTSSQQGTSDPPRTSSLARLDEPEDATSIHIRQMTFEAEIKSGTENVFSYDLKTSAL